MARRGGIVERQDRKERRGTGGKEGVEMVAVCLLTRGFPTSFKLNLSKSHSGGGGCNTESRLYEVASYARRLDANQHDRHR
jgi:hypothetical protein